MELTRERRGDVELFVSGVSLPRRRFCRTSRLRESEGEGENTTLDSRLAIRQHAKRCGESTMLFCHRPYVAAATGTLYKMVIVTVIDD